MKYQYILFDLDGTLFDYDKAERAALGKTFRQFGLEFSPEYLDIYRTINRQIWQDYEKGFISQTTLKTARFKRLADKLLVDYNAESFSRQYLVNLSECTDLIDDAPEMLKKIPAEIELYLITNGLKSVQRPRISASTIKPYFKDIIISEEVGSAKPAAEIFDKTFKIMGMPSKKEVLIVGDSLTSDIAGGVNYGIDTCWYNPQRTINDNGFHPTYEIQHLIQLDSIIK